LNRRMSFIEIWYSTVRFVVPHLIILEITVFRHRDTCKALRLPADINGFRLHPCIPISRCNAFCCTVISLMRYFFVGTLLIEHFQVLLLCRTAGRQNEGFSVEDAVEQIVCSNFTDRLQQFPATIFQLHLLRSADIFYSINSAYKVFHLLTCSRSNRRPTDVGEWRNTVHSFRATTFTGHVVRLTAQ
jgi:hypothetical protein